MADLLREIQESGTVSTEQLRAKIGASRSEMKEKLQALVYQGYLKEVKKGSTNCLGCPLQGSCPTDSPLQEKSSSVYLLTAKGRELVEDTKG